jgi:hypothetical protein
MQHQQLHPRERIRFHRIFIDWYVQASETDLQTLRSAHEKHTPADTAVSDLAFICECWNDNKRLANLPTSLINQLKNQRWPRVFLLKAPRRA